jgi:magnesium transporter
MSTELTREYISDLRAIIDVRDDETALAKLETLHPADLAEIYESLSLEEVTYLFLLLDP